MSGVSFEKHMCRLSDEERNDRAKALALEGRTKAENTAAKATLAQTYAKRIKESERRIAELEEVVLTGVEYRLVPVVKREAGMMIETVRVDTGEVVSVQAIRYEDRQVEMFADAAASCEGESLANEGEPVEGEGEPASGGDAGEANEIAPREEEKEAAGVPTTGATDIAKAVEFAKAEVDVSAVLVDVDDTAPPPTVRSIESTVDA